MNRCLIRCRASVFTPHAFFHFFFWSCVWNYCVQQVQCDKWLWCRLWQRTQNVSCCSGKDIDINLTNNSSSSDKYNGQLSQRRTLVGELFCCVVMHGQDSDWLTPNAVRCHDTFPAWFSYEFTHNTNTLFQICFIQTGNKSPDSHQVIKLQLLELLTPHNIQKNAVFAKNTL